MLAMIQSFNWRKACVVMAFGVMAIGSASVISSPAVAGIKDTKHNLGSTQTDQSNNNYAGGTSEICVFCHTPHGANTDMSAPLWNKSRSDNPTYTVYDSATLDSIPTSGDVKSSVSFACLSCHDGTQAMDAMINMPGSGASTGITFNWQGSRQSSGKLTGIAALGTDLSNDHPIGMPYANYGSAAATQRDKDVIGASQDATTSRYMVDVASWKSASGAAGGTGTANTLEKTDMILYTRGSSGTVPYVECASCHDPHSSNALFLRIPNYGSQVCLACHNK